MSPYDLIGKLQEIDKEIVNSLITIKDKTKVTDLEDVRIDIARLINKVSHVCR